MYYKLIWSHDKIFKVGLHVRHSEKRFTFSNLCWLLFHVCATLCRNGALFFRIRSLPVSPAGVIRDIYLVGGVFYNRVFLLCLPIHRPSPYVDPCTRPADIRYHDLYAAVALESTSVLSLQSLVLSSSFFLYSCRYLQGRAINMSHASSDSKEDAGTQPLELQGVIGFNGMHEYIITYIRTDTHTYTLMLRGHTAPSLHRFRGYILLFIWHVWSSRSTCRPCPFPLSIVQLFPPSLHSPLLPLLCQVPFLTVYCSTRVTNT